MKPIIAFTLIALVLIYCAVVAVDMADAIDNLKHAQMEMRP